VYRRDDAFVADFATAIAAKPSLKSLTATSDFATRTPMFVEVPSIYFSQAIPLPKCVPESTKTINVTHQFADFVRPVYESIKQGILKARVLSADETPHKMLEGSDTKSWYLWGFSTPEHCFLECHDTRSGDVASDILLNSKCEVLVSDVYSGYAKAIRIVNQSRLLKGLAPIENANCNAHARRYFFKSRLAYPDAEFYLDHYHEIYQLNSAAKGRPPEEVLKMRAEMRPLFEAMRQRAMDELLRYSIQSKFGKAFNYFLENYDGLTIFLDDVDVPIDNNSQERLLRNHVVGRKTWYVALGKVWTKGTGDEYILKLCNRSSRVKVPSGQSLTNRSVVSLAG
jgi:hypothetical protein